MLSPVLILRSTDQVVVDEEELDSTYVRNASSLLINHQVPLLMRRELALTYVEECQFSSSGQQRQDEERTGIPHIC